MSAKPLLIEDPRIQSFLVKLRDTGNWALSARLSGVSENTAHGWRKRLPGLRAECDGILSIWRGDTGIKKCRKCKVERPIAEFNARDTKQMPRAVCKECYNTVVRNCYSRFKEKSFFKHKAGRAKTRATRLGVPYNIDNEYLEGLWTGYCAVSGVKLTLGTAKEGGCYEETSAELDRLVPEKGYVKGNVAFLSRRMNRIKNNSTREEIELLNNWFNSNES